MLSTVNLVLHNCIQIWSLLLNALVSGKGSGCVNAKVIISLVWAKIKLIKSAIISIQHCVWNDHVF